MGKSTRNGVTLPERRVQAFFYLLIREYLPTGDIEMLFEMLRETNYDGEIIFSCPHTEALSGSLARRLLGTGSGMSDNEVRQHEDHCRENNETDSRSEEVEEGGVATGEGYPQSNEDDARVREAKEDDGCGSESYDPYDVLSVERQATTVKKSGFDYGEGLPEANVLNARVKADEEDGGYLNSSGFPVTEDEIVSHYLDGEGKATRIEEDDAEGHVFNAEGEDEYGYDRDGVHRNQREASATRIEKDDLGIDFLKEEDRPFNTFKDSGSNSSSSTASESEAEAEAETES